MITDASTDHIRPHLISNGRDIISLVSIAAKVIMLAPDNSSTNEIKVYSNKRVRYAFICLNILDTSLKACSVNF